jgi:hypothetical protein
MSSEMNVGDLPKSLEAVVGTDRE